MILLLFLYDIRSERGLMDIIPEHLDWLWFLGYDLEDEILNNSVLSNAIAGWGSQIFKRFFEPIAYQCVEEGLVDGFKGFFDASLIGADASNNSVVDTKNIKRYLDKGNKSFENRLDEIKASKNTPADSRYISTIDPDASITRHNGGKSKLRYKTHRAVDEKHTIRTMATSMLGRIGPKKSEDFLIVMMKGIIEIQSFDKSLQLI